MSDLIDPKEIVIIGQDQKPHKYTISKLPYMLGGREILTQYIPTGAPKIGDYKANEELANKMFGFISVNIGGVDQRLITPELISNHVPDFKTGITLEKEMLEYNFGFFDLGKISTSLEGIATIVQEWIIKTLTESQARSSLTEKPH